MKVGAVFREMQAHLDKTFLVISERASLSAGYGLQRANGSSSKANTWLGLDCCENHGHKMGKVDNRALSKTAPGKLMRVL